MISAGATNRFYDVTSPATSTAAPAMSMTAERNQLPEPAAICPRRQMTDDDNRFSLRPVRYVANIDEQFGLGGDNVIALDTTARSRLAQRRTNESAEGVARDDPRTTTARHLGDCFRASIAPPFRATMARR